jgi:hypothetical protein
MGGIKDTPSPSVRRHSPIVDSDLIVAALDGGARPPPCTRRKRLRCAKVEERSDFPPFQGEG